MKLINIIMNSIMNIRINQIHKHHDKHVSPCTLSLNNHDLPSELPQGPWGPLAAAPSPVATGRARAPSGPAGVEAVLGLEAGLVHVAELGLLGTRAGYRWDPSGEGWRATRDATARDPL